MIIMIDRKTVERVAKVARLDLTDSELEKYSRDLKNIIDAFEIIKKVDTDKVKPTFQPVELRNVLRKDEIGRSLPQEEALSNTKNKERGYFRGPKAV
jgi:aspartyl-tRNA(Asn)/glutamyl-tRNA(Gln) amidotransferase subunit C